MFPLSLVYLFFTIVRPQDYLPGFAGLPVMPVVLVVAFLGWLLSRKTLAAPQFLLLPAFLLVAMASQVVNGWSGGAIEVLGNLGPAVIIFFVLAATLTSHRRMAITFAVIGLCAMVLALHSVQQADQGVGWTGVPLGEDGRIRYVGIFNDPNDIGLLFVMALPMVMFLGTRGGFLRRIFWLAGAALLLFGVYLTQSRGTQLAVLVMIGVYIWRRRGVVTAAILGVAGLAGMMAMPSSRMQSLDVDEASAFGRVDAWYEGLHMFMADPLFGIGAGNFTDYNYLTAHNSFVLVLAETGFLGYLAWLSFVGYCFWMMLTMLRYKPAPPADPAVPAQPARAGVPAAGPGWAAERSLALTLFCALCGFFAAAFFLSRSYNIMLYVLAAVAVGHYVSASARFPALPTFRLLDSGGRWVLIAMGSIVALFLIVALLLRTV